jgi:hypothetical protein
VQVAGIVIYRLADPVPAANSSTRVLYAVYYSESFVLKAVISSAVEFPASTA